MSPESASTSQETAEADTDSAVVERWLEQGTLPATSDYFQTDGPTVQYVEAPLPIPPRFRRRPFRGADVSVQLIFIGEFTSNYNPIVGVVADEATALKLFHRHTEHKISWEKIAVSDATEIPAPGAPLWVLIQGGPFSPTAYSNPSPVAAYADRGRAIEEIARRKELYGEELLLWCIPLGTIDFTAPDWSYTGA